MTRHLTSAAVALAALLLGPGIAAAQCTGIPSANTVCAGPPSGGGGQFRARALVPGDLAGIPEMPTVQTLTSGSGTYTPTSSAVQWIRVKMSGGGGGGGAAGNGTTGGTTSFAGWSAVGGGGGGVTQGTQAGAGGVGGTGGTNGAGVVVDRKSGAPGQSGLWNQTAALITMRAWGAGGTTVGKGGYGAAALLGQVGSGGGGGQGEQLEFMMTIAELGSSAAWAVGDAGAGAAGNANIETANAGTIGRIRVEEYYGPAQPAAVMAAVAAAQAAAFAGGGHDLTITCRTVLATG